ncbi:MULTISPECIES: hypothetical protein [Nocardia]|uniref:hypothetical protein n=1 Tax=Nocardia TaxID=1817 RepID=UPI000D697D4C|nr:MULTISPECIES: hypothetical protein [Nocardia]
MAPGGGSGAVTPSMRAPSTIDTGPREFDDAYGVRVYVHDGDTLYVIGATSGSDDTRPGRPI